MSERAAAGHHIADVVRETGLGQDTLRVWERRYGFPRPSRDAHGERRYDDEQLLQLRLLRQLLDRGHRAGQVVGLPLAELRALQARLPAAEAPRRRGRPPRLAPSAGAATPASAGSGLDPAWLALVRESALDELRQRCRSHLLQQGLVATLEQVLAPLAHEVGRAWATGALSIYQEHLFSEVAETVLREAIAVLEAPGRLPRAGPRVLLTTLAGEQHTLGLLMAEAVLAQLGCTRLPLGPGTPVSEIAAAADRLQADVVALGSSTHAVPRVLRAELQRLRALLPPPRGLWLGGAPALRVPGVQAVQRVGDLAALVAAWRAANAPAPEPQPAGGLASAADPLRPAAPT